MDLSLTPSGAIVGTPLYMAPEQHRGRRADARSDQFAFCVALFQALYRTPPFDGRDMAELAANAMAGRVCDPPGDAVVPPPRLRRVVLRGLLPAPESRHPSMDVLLEELARNPERRRRRAGIAAAVVALVGWVGVALWQTDSPGRHLCHGAQQQLAGIRDDRVKVLGARVIMGGRESAQPRAGWPHATR